MSLYRLKHLVIKPTLLCTANCPTCGTRKILHNKLRGKKILEINDWKKVLMNAKRLGVERLDISGGEPTLFEDLEKIVAIGGRNNWFVNMNTNGNLIKNIRAKELIKSGLNNVYVSLYSHSFKKHDLMRGQRGLWEQATQTIKIFSDFQNKNFTLKTQTLINKMNYKDLPSLIKLNIDLGVNEMAVSYLEGDINKKLLLNKDEIKEFREEVAPKCITLINANYQNIKSKQKARAALNNIFSNDISVEEWTSGIYRPERKILSKCSRPQWFSIILANGDVHPCNAIEYTHEPIMGNVLNNSLINIWQGKKFNDFRDHLFDYCAYCPINLYTIIPLQ